MSEHITIPINGNTNDRRLRTSSVGGVRGVRGVLGVPFIGEGAGTDPCGDFMWSVEDGARANYDRLGERLSAFDDLFRNGSNGVGLIQLLPSGKTRVITKAPELAPIIADRITIVIVKAAKIIGDMPSAQHLNALLRTETFLSRMALELS
jgi:hypothetical protein